jgi:acyl-CoA dehydrogenase
MVSFDVEPGLAADLAWIQEFIASEIEPLDLAFGGEAVVYDKSHPVHGAHIRPLQDRVRARGLWSCHLTPQFGGQGYGQVQLALMNEILGRERYLAPLLDGRISSCYAMTEPQGGADPSLFTTRAVREGDSWVIDGEKWFSSSFEKAAFTIVMAVTNPDVSVYQGTSMFLVPAGTPGLQVVRRTGMGYDPEGTGNHPYVRYDGVVVPAENLLGGEGQAFAIAQTRLGGGRLHHAMRTVGAVARCLDMLCERALSRHTAGKPLARHQLTQEKISDAWIELTQFRLQVLHAAWCVDTHGAKAARREIAGVKVATPKVFHNAVLRTMHAHGALGVSNEMPLASMLLGSVALGIADGPTEVHQATIAREVLKEHHPAQGPWPSEHLPARRAAARTRYAALQEI